MPLFDPFDFAGPCCKLAKRTTQRGINQPRRLFEISFVRFDINARSPRSSALPPRGRLSSRSQLISQQPFVRWLTGGTRSAPMSFPLARRGLANRRSDGALRHAYVLMHECYAATPERNMQYHAYSPWSARLGGVGSVGRYHVGLAMRDEVRKNAVGDRRPLFCRDENGTYCLVTTGYRGMLK